MSVGWSSDSLFFLPRPPPSSAHPSPCPSSSSFHSRHHTGGSEREITIHQACRLSSQTFTGAKWEKSHACSHIVPSHLHSQPRITTSARAQWILCTLLHFNLPALLADHSLNSASSSFIGARKRVCVCVLNSWKNGASWKSSAAVSLLLAACVHVSDGGMHRENERSVSM